LGYQAVTALEWQDHLSSRLKLMASLAKCLLDPRALEFFRFRSVGCVGQKSLYPFAVLLCPLSAERRSEVLEQAQRWPEPQSMFREPAKRQPSDSQVRDFFNLVAALSKQNKPQMVYDLAAKPGESLRFNCKNSV
jgi:hypothetical protein